MDEADATQKRRISYISLATFAAAAASDFNLIRRTHKGSKPSTSKRTRRNRVRNKMARESRRRNR